MTRFVMPASPPANPPISSRPAGETRALAAKTMLRSKYSSRRFAFSQRVLAVIIRQMFLRGYWVVVFLLLVLGIPAFSDDWYQNYLTATYLIEQGNCEEAEKLLQEAMKVSSKSDFRKDYFPHFYLAQCSLERGDVETAQKHLKQAEGGGILFSGKAREYKNFKDKLKEKLKEPKQKTRLWVLVNLANPVTGVSLKELEQIYRGEKTAWSDGTPIIPVLGPLNSPENRLFLSKVCRMDEKKHQELWQEKQPQNGSNKLPVVVEKQEWVLRYVFSNPGAIAFHAASESSPAQAKIIPVEGKNASAADYPLSE